jgi:hypothetical protein
MKTTSALKVLAKKSIIVIEPRTTEANYNRGFEAVVNGYRLTVTTQGEDVSTMRVARVSDRDEILSDYFAGSYFDTMPQIFRYIGV